MFWVYVIMRHSNTSMRQLNHLPVLFCPLVASLRYDIFSSNNTVNTLLTSAVLPWDLIHKAHH